MKKLISILMCFVMIWTCFASVWIPTYEVNGFYNESSYDVPAYLLSEDYFCTYFHNGYPQFTNHIYSWSRSGSSWPGDIRFQREKLITPLMSRMITPVVWDWNLANDNGGSGDTNVTYAWGLEFTNSPPVFYDGTNFIDYGSNFLTNRMIHFFMGGIPGGVLGLDGSPDARNEAARQLNQMQGLGDCDLLHELWTNGWNADYTNATPKMGFYIGGHPYPAGHLAMAIYQLLNLNVETNIGSFSLNWLGRSCYSTNFIVSNASMNYDTFSCTIQATKVPMSWDVPGDVTPQGVVTNDARPCFEVIPSLANAMNWTFSITNLPPGMYAAYVDGELTDVATSTQWAASRNWFTNYNGPFWRDRLKSLIAKRYQHGVDPTTLINHSAGDVGYLGRADLVNYGSYGHLYWDELGNHGTNYINLMSDRIDDVLVYDVNIHNVSQPTSHTLKLVRLSKVAVQGKNIIIRGKGVLLR